MLFGEPEPERVGDGGCVEEGAVEVEGEDFGHLCCAARERGRMRGGMDAVGTTAEFPAPVVVACTRRIDRVAGCHLHM